MKNIFKNGKNIIVKRVIALISAIALVGGIILSAMPDRALRATESPAEEAEQTEMNSAEESSEGLDVAHEELVLGEESEVQEESAAEAELSETEEDSVKEEAEGENAPAPAEESDGSADSRPSEEQNNESSAEESTEQPAGPEDDETPGEPVNETEKEEHPEQDTESSEESAAEPEEQELIPEETVILYPAQSFEGKTDNVSVRVSAPEGALPAGSVMELTDVFDEDTLRTVTDAASAENPENAVVTSVYSVDITFYNEAGEKIEPLVPIMVLMNLTENAAKSGSQAVEKTAEQTAESSAPAGRPQQGISEEDSTVNVSLVHLTDEGDTEVLSLKADDETKEAIQTAADETGMTVDVEKEKLATSDSVSMKEAGSVLESTVVFESDKFSVYSIIYTVVVVEIKEEFTLRSKETYEISVKYDESANIPDGAELSVVKAEEGTEAYEEAVDRMIRALSDRDGVAAVGEARVFDISILYNGEKIEPAAPVEVQVELIDAVQMDEEKDFRVVHFAEEGAEILEPAVSDPAAEEVSSFSFETGSFSTFAFGSANYIGSLNGQSFALVRDNGSDKAAIVGEQLNPERLKGTYVNILEEGVLTSVTQAKGNKESDLPLTAWTFEHVRDNLYRVRSDSGLYMNMSETAITLSGKATLIEVYPLDNKGALSGYVRLRNGENPKYCLNNKGGKPVTGGFQVTTTTDANSKFALYPSASGDANSEIKAGKVSAQDLEGGKSYVLYSRIYNEETEAYELFVVDGDGNLIYAFDNGDTIGYRTEASTTWYLIEYTDDSGVPTGYYDFYNAVTGHYLTPQKGTALSDQVLGVHMSGKENDAYSTPLDAWDNKEKVYYALAADIENRVLYSGTEQEAAEFSFAEPAVFEADELHEVSTVDSRSNGISIDMYNFKSREMMNLFNNDVWYQNGEFKQGLLKPVLGADGFPVSATGRSFSEIYNSSNNRGSANHIFLKSVYDATGYYEYDAFNNFAEYDHTTGNFKVYEEMGIPKNGAGGSVSSFYRGNFLPYNHLDVTKPATNTRLYDSLYGWVSLENPVFNDKMYLMKETVDYFFGTVINAEFMQAEDGKDVHGAPVVYEFMGDDDLWVFIDNVLTLDLGGIHSAVSGSINFSTGTVDAGGIKTTIKDCFRNAGIFPDGTAWDESLVSDYFAGETFNDYTSHSFKMIYQERGAGSSTLKMRFNLPVVERGTFAVEKQLAGTGQTNYANVQFAYQAFVKADGGDVALYPGLYLSEDGNPSSADDPNAQAVGAFYESSGAELPFYDDASIAGKQYDHVFYLRPGEAAVFSGIPENVPYYVREINVSGAYYDTVMINDADMGGENGFSEDENITATSSEKTIRQRQRVLFINRCSSANMKDLRITKHVDNPVDDGAEFEFRIMLEGADGKLNYYSRGEYYLVKADVNTGEEHYYSYVNGVLTDLGTEPAVCSVSGQFGTIAGIPDGFTVVIRGLLADTDFFVEEIRNPAGYEMIAKNLKNGSYDTAEIEGADGRIKLRENAEMTIVNHRYSVIRAEKEWVSDIEFTSHGKVRFALFEKDEKGNETPVQEGDILKSPVLVEMSAPDTPVFWELELPAEQTLDNYVVREVTVKEDGSFEPAAEGGMVTVSEEKPKEAEASEENSYTVSYQSGDSSVKEKDSYRIFERTDTVINTLYTEPEGTALPHTGGSGTGPFRTAGALLIVIAVFLFTLKHYREKEN